MSNIDPKEICGNCVHFAKERAECRRYAPRGGSEEDRIWPQVKVQEWCSEFKYNPNMKVYLAQRQDE